MMNAPHEPELDAAQDHELERLRSEYAQRRQRLDGLDTYSLFNPGHLYMTQQRQRALLALLRREGLLPFAQQRMLEVGCGSGGVLREFLWYGATPASLHGAELLVWRVAEAKALTPHVPVVQADGCHLPYADKSFDLVMQFTVFSSILDAATRAAVAAEMRRVVRPDGLILWYDFWLNPRNPHTRGIRPAEIRTLFPACSYRFQRLTLAPPITRWMGRVSWPGCYLLEQLRILNTHYLVAIRPRP